MKMKNATLYGFFFVAFSFSSLTCFDCSLAVLKSLSRPHYTFVYWQWFLLRSFFFAIWQKNINTEYCEWTFVFVFIKEIKVKEKNVLWSKNCQSNFIFLNIFCTMSVLWHIWSMMELFEVFNRRNIITHKIVNIFRKCRKKKVEDGKRFMWWQFFIFNKIQGEESFSF